MSSATQFGEQQQGPLNGGLPDFKEAFERYARQGHRLEIPAMILAFILYWPAGLAILGMRIWRRKSWNREGFGFAGPAYAMRGFACGRGEARSDRAGERRTAWAARQWNAAATGNAAFDDWRDAELARIEEEVQKLVSAQREFESHLENLRRAKDREEFDSFMAARRAAAAQPPQAAPQV